MQFDKTQGTDMHLKRYRKVHEMFKSYRCIIITLSILKYHSLSQQEGKVNINNRMKIQMYIQRELTLNFEKKLCNKKEVPPYERKKNKMDSVHSNLAGNL